MNIFASEPQFTLLSRNCDPDEVATALFENARYAEFAYRLARGTRGRVGLRNSLARLLAELPPEARAKVTDDVPAWIREIVVARNWLAHGSYHLPAPLPCCLYRLAIQLGLLLFQVEAQRQCESAALLAPRRS